MRLWVGAPLKAHACSGPAANSCRQPYASSCWPTAMAPHSFGSCSPLPLAYTWPLPIVKQICLMFPLFRSSLQKTADARSSCVSYPYVLPHNKIFALPRFGQNCFMFENEAYQMKGQNAYKTLFRRRKGGRLPGRSRSRWKKKLLKWMLKKM